MENREILSYFDILALSKCILYFDILLVFRILILKFSRVRSQIISPRLEVHCGVHGPRHRPLVLRLQEDGLQGQRHPDCPAARGRDHVRAHGCGPNRTKTEQNRTE